MATSYIFNPFTGTFDAVDIGANQALSNLTNPTAVNQDLLFNTGTTANLKTQDGTTSQQLNIETGVASTGASGWVFLESGNANTNSGRIVIGSGQATTGASGPVVISTNSNTGTSTGSISLTSGSPTNSNFSSGSLTFNSGDVLGSGVSGGLSLTSGAGDTNGSGSLSLTSGTVTSGVSGSITLTTGDTDQTQPAGDISLVVGNGGSPQNGKIRFITLNAVAAGYVWTNTDGVSAGDWMPLPAAAANNKELFVLSSTDITNQYIDLANIAKTNSINFIVQGSGSQIEGASYDYSVNYTGGVGGFTRITFLNGLAIGGVSALVAGDVVVAQYQY